MMDQSHAENSDTRQDLASFVEDVKSELQEIDNSDLSEHTQRFEALHQKLSQALTNIDGL